MTWSPSCSPCRLESGQPELSRESSLKFQTRSLAVYTDGRGYALGSVEGRVSMEFFDQSPEVQVRAWRECACVLAHMTVAHRRAACPWSSLASRPRCRCVHGTGGQTFLLKSTPVIHVLAGGCAVEVDVLVAAAAIMGLLGHSTLVRADTWPDTTRRGARPAAP